MPQLKHYYDTYTSVMVETLNLKMNETQKEVWTLSFAEFTDEVLEEGWLDFIDNCTPNFVPKINDAKKVFQSAKIRIYERFVRVEKDKIPDPTPEEKIEFQKMSKQYKKVLAEVNPNSPKGKADQMMRKWWIEQGDMNMARKHEAILDQKGLSYE